jgi:murein DD-endopeptidase MepM/ murein hydrolase activator NlpD
MNSRTRRHATAGQVAMLTVAAIALTAMQAASAPACAQGLYRYQDADGRWHFSDRPPPDDRAAVAEPLPVGDKPPGVDLEPVADPAGIRVSNRYHMPIQIVLRTSTDGDTVGALERVIGARATLIVPLGDLSVGATIRHGYVLGDPEAAHRPEQPYRVPFSVASRFRISQGFGGGITHKDPSSHYAIDIAMPVGTAIVAARDGIVVETAYTHYDGGVDIERDGPRANLIRIAHADGTYALYAHLDRASIGVKPGDRVRRGQRIGASGNSGFSSGPHLHFAILRNSGMRVVSEPFVFAGSNGEPITPQQGELLTAYP